MEVNSSIATDGKPPSETAIMLGNPKQSSSSWRSAVTIGAVITGAFCVLGGSMILNNAWSYPSLGTLIQTSAGFAYIVACTDVAIIISVLAKNGSLLKHSLCASMAVHMVSLPLVFCIFFVVTLATPETQIAAWEMPRFFICFAHLVLMYLLLLDLRETEEQESNQLPPPEEKLGWLKKNLALTGPTKHAGDKLILKLHVKQ